MIPAKTIKPEKNVETLLAGTFSHASGEPFSCVRDRLRQVPYATHISPPVIHKPVFVTCPLGIHGRDPSDITIEIHLVTGTERSCPVHVSLGESRPGMVNLGICCLQRRKAVPEFVNLLFLPVIPVEQAPAHNSQFHLVGHAPSPQVALVCLLIIIGARTVSLFDVRHQRAPLLVVILALLVRIIQILGFVFLIGDILGYLEPVLVNGIALGVLVMCGQLVNGPCWSRHAIVQMICLEDQVFLFRPVIDKRRVQFLAQLLDMIAFFPRLQYPQIPDQPHLRVGSTVSG